MGKKFRGRSLVIWVQQLHDVRLESDVRLDMRGFLALLSSLLSHDCEKTCISKLLIQFRTRREREKPRTIPTALFLQLGQQKFPRYWKVDFYLCLISETYVTKPTDPGKAKTIVTWLSLLVMTYCLVLDTSLLQTRKNLIPRKEKECEYLIAIKSILENTTENVKYFHVFSFIFHFSFLYFVKGEIAKCWGYILTKNRLLSKNDCCEISNLIPC